MWQGVYLTFVVLKFIFGDVFIVLYRLLSQFFFGRQKNLHEVDETEAEAKQKHIFALYQRDLKKKNRVNVMLLIYADVNLNHTYYFTSLLFYSS